LAGVTHVGAQSQPSFAQVVALDECDPATFNTSAGAGPDFCKNVALGASTALSDLLAKAAAGTPDLKWDFEPDNLSIKQGQVVSVVDQGVEPHTFTEVKQFGGGFISGLNGPGETVVPECAGGFSNVAVARTRILQGSHLDVIGLSKGKHLFQCCIHPWMRIEVDVK
jgi:plastocyanin